MVNLADDVRIGEQNCPVRHLQVAIITHDFDENPCQFARGRDTAEVMRAILMRGLF